MIVGQARDLETRGYKRFIILTRTIHFEVFEVEGRDKETTPLLDWTGELVQYSTVQ